MDARIIARPSCVSARVGAKSWEHRRRLDRLLGVKTGASMSWEAVDGMKTLVLQPAKDAVMPMRWTAAATACRDAFSASSGWQSSRSTASPGIALGWIYPELKRAWCPRTRKEFTQ